MPCVYLIHFERPYVSPGPNPKVISHYLGATSLSLSERIYRHRNGHGAALLRAVNRAGIEWHVVRSWPVDTKKAAFDLEIALKRRRRHKEYCPICQHNQRPTLVQPQNHQLDNHMIV